MLKAFFNSSFFKVIYFIPSILVTQSISHNPRIDTINPKIATTARTFIINAVIDTAQFSPMQLNDLCEKYKSNNIPPTKINNDTKNIFKSAIPDIRTKYDTVKKTDLAKYGISHNPPSKEIPIKIALSPRQPNRYCLHRTYECYSASACFLGHHT